MPAALIAAALVAAAAPRGVPSKAASPNLIVDFGTPIRQLDSMAIGMDESGYGYPNVLVNDSQQAARLKALNLGAMRVELKYSRSGDPTSQIVCGGDGCDMRWTGDQWISAIKAAGAEPVVIVGIHPADALNDAVNMVSHFNVQTGNRVGWWIISNEPDLNGVSAPDYSNSFNALYDAMKAVDPTIRIGGGATAWYDRPFLETFLSMSGARVDFVDFHGYAQKGASPGDPAHLFQVAAGFGSDVRNLRALIDAVAPSRAQQIQIEVGEWALNSAGNAQDDTVLNFVWTADALGHILGAGASALFYADKGNALYMTTRRIDDGSGRLVTLSADDARPAYQGIGMYTGQGLFPRFGSTLVAASASIPGIDVFASDNPKLFLVINKDPVAAQWATARLLGLASGRISVWRKDTSMPFAAPPSRLGVVAFGNSTFSYPIPPLSVTAFVVDAATAASPTPAAAGQPVAQDTFQRPDQLQWGQASNGDAWRADAATAPNFAISGNQGVISGGSTNYNGILGPAFGNGEVSFSGSMHVFHDTNIGAVLAYSDPDNWYKAYLDGVSLVMQKRVAGVATMLASVPFAAAPDTAYSVRFKVSDGVLSAKAWPAGSPEPTQWMVWAADSTFSSGSCGIRSLVQGPGASASFSAFRCTRAG